MEQESTVEMTDEGANEHVSNDSSQVDTNEESPNSLQQNEEAVDNEESSSEDNSKRDDLRFDRHPRWQKLQRQLRKFKEVEREYNEYKQQTQDAVNIKNWLSQNPHLISKLLEMSKNVEGAVAEEDPFADLDPRLANEFRGMKKAINDYERLQHTVKQQEQERAQALVQQHQEMLSDYFDDLLRQDGVIKPNGEVVKDLSNLYTVTTRAVLDNFAKDPNKPTLKELKEAYSYVKQAIQKEANRSLSKLTKQNNQVPPSSYSRGVPPSNYSKGKEYNYNEIAELLKS